MSRGSRDRRWTDELVSPCFFFAALVGFTFLLARFDMVFLGVEARPQLDRLPWLAGALAGVGGAFSRRSNAWLFGGTLALVAAMAATIAAI